MQKRPFPPLKNSLFSFERASKTIPHLEKEILVPIEQYLSRQQTVGRSRLKVLLAASHGIFVDVPEACIILPEGSGRFVEDNISFSCVLMISIVKPKK
jgi:hypothetical protein